MMKKGVRYEYCNGREAGIKKSHSRTGKSFAAEKTIRKNDKKIER